MAELQALCMRCRDEKNKPTMQTMTNPTVEEKNNRYSAKGICAKCGGNMFKFLSKDDAMKLQAEG
ncbi:MAG: DUF5679 domain-containing protein [Candidatus Paceibacterota bacterium]